MNLWNRLFPHKLKLAAPLQPGDMAVIKTKGQLGSMIRFFCRWLKDPGFFSHAVIITDPLGDTLEANFRFGVGKLSDYTGDQILIVRDLRMTPERCQSGLDAIKSDLGNLYPIWRLPLFIIGIDKYCKFGEGVCSEETGKFMKGAGFDNVVYGLTPDDLGMLWRKEIADGHMIAVHDGVL